jgi:hypothetical protein
VFVVAAAAVVASAVVKSHLVFVSISLFVSSQQQQACWNAVVKHLAVGERERAVVKVVATVVVLREGVVAVERVSRRLPLLWKNSGQYPAAQRRGEDCITSSVVDPHHLDADPDSTYYPDADPESDFHLMRIRIWIRLFTLTLIWIRIQIQASK